MPLTITDAITDPQLLASACAGPSWNTWKAVIRAAEGLPLDEDQLALFQAVAERPPPQKRVKEFVVIAGRRSGKDSIAAVIAVVAALGDYRKSLRPGERASILCLAVDRSQARIVHRYISGLLRENALLAPLIVREDDNTIELSNNVEIIIQTNSFRAVRGRTIICAIFDEASFWHDQDYANPDTEVYAACRPGLATLADSMLIVISTPYKRSGLLFNKWRTAYGKDDPNVLVVRGPTPLFNPLIPQDIIDAALADDPEAAAAEWMAEWRSDISDFLDRELIDEAVDHGVTIRPPRPGVGYNAGGDPSGGRGDSFGVVIVHLDQNGVVIVDNVAEWRAPFDPSKVVAEIAALLRSYGLSSLTGDKYAAAWVDEAFAKEGIRYVQADRDRSGFYLDLLPLFTAGRIRLIDNPRLIRQFAELERRTNRSGKDRIDHPPAGADDLANATAIAAVLAVADAAPALWRRSDLLAAGIPVTWPCLVSSVFATVGIDASGLVVAYWATGMPHRPPNATVLLLDFERSALTRELFRSVRRRMLDFANAAALNPEWGAPPALGLFGQSVLGPYSEPAGLPVQEAAACEAVLADRSASMLAAAAAIAAGEVKVTALAMLTAESGVNPLVTIFPGIGPSAAQDCALLGVCCTLPPEAQPPSWQPSGAARISISGIV